MAIPITEELIATIRNLSRLGHTQYYISQIINIPTSTLSDWKRNNPQIASALSIGQDGVLSDVKSRMTSIALNGSDTDSIKAGQYLLTRYETETTTDTSQAPTDEAIRDEILNELKT